LPPRPAPVFYEHTMFRALPQGRDAPRNADTRPGRSQRTRRGARVFSGSDRVLHPVPLLGPLGGGAAVQGAHQRAGHAADALGGDAVGLGAAAAGALVADDAGEAAHRVPVHRVVDAAVADAVLLHIPDDPLEGLQILTGVSVHLDV